MVLPPHAAIPVSVPGGFADGGTADLLPPGSELARLLTAATGKDGAVLGTLPDEEVLGVLAAGGRMAAWAAWAQLVALAEFARRRPPVHVRVPGAREVAEEAAWKMAETWTRMLDKLPFAVTVAGQAKNPAGLRDYARRQVMRLDPAAAVRRKERARQDAYVQL